MHWVGGALPCVVQVQGLLFCCGRGGRTTGASRTGTTQKNAWLSRRSLRARSLPPRSGRPLPAGRSLARPTEKMRVYRPNKRRRLNPPSFFQSLSDDAIIRTMAFLGSKDVSSLLLTNAHFATLMPRLVCEAAGGAANVPTPLLENETPLKLLAFVLARRRSRTHGEGGELQLAPWGGEAAGGAGAFFAFRTAEFASLPPFAASPAPFRVIQIAASDAGDLNHGLLVALDDQGRVWTLESNAKSRLPRLQHVLFPDKGKVVRVATGGGSSAAIMDNGQVFAWGENNHGKLGVPDAAAAGIIPPTLSQMPAGEIVVDVILGVDHAIFVTVNGCVFTCGNNLQGQLGLGDLIERHTPTLAVVSSARAVQAAAGKDFTLLLLCGGTVLAAGVPPPRLGQAQSTTFMPAFPGLRCGSLSACHLSAGVVAHDGRLWVSGYGYGSSMGAAAGRHHFAKPVHAPTPAPVASFQATQLRSVAVLKDGRAVFYHGGLWAAVPSGVVVLQVAITSSYRAIISPLLC